MRPLAKTCTLMFLALGLLASGGCTKVDSVGLYDPNESTAPSPTISGISPAGSAFAGMDTVIIQGTNFSSVPGNNTVFFNAQQAVLLSASPTQIALIAPLVTMDSVAVRVSVTGALMFSNAYRYRLIAGVGTFGGLATTESAASLATDATGNLYAAYCAGGKDAGILKLTPSASQSTYAPATPVVTIWTSLKMGPAGYLYAARNVRAIYRFVPGGGSSAAIWTSAVPAGTYITDIDFDRTGNLWCGGSSGNIYRVDAVKVITTYPFTGNLRSVRFYSDYLYFAAKTDAGEKIWRAPITAGALGTPETYFDFGAAYPGKTPLAITFSSDGYLYIGTDSQEGLVVVTPNKSFSAPFAAYQSLFSTGIGFLAWGSADDLYASAVNGTLLRFTIRGKTTAPYFGSTL